ncbi:uncharacterized protein BXZ73DRAFT_103827 [Epithele typhae]|uniref:uncharacterized protein n=1 Tax=Epithele typhae TaxID=378194 RepID=UPI002007CA11|nr:uncharacterized protein BXZ73DRAFT_103827 [Epithele typhae]KAH9923779.1 hypothetical protein BXZ73DRAFT_103827 [Epithele typhae]
MVPGTPRLKRLQAPLTGQPSLCSGILELPKDKLELYYGYDSPRPSPRSPTKCSGLFHTTHEGGTLFLHDREKVVSGALLKDYPCTVAYPAFFSDVENEVTPLLSGHRVNITYNLRSPAPRRMRTPTRSRSRWG